MTFKSFKEFEKALISQKVDKQSCIDFFIDISQKESHIAFSSKMVINLFRYKHDYIFKTLFDKGIIYSTFIDSVVLQRLSKESLKSESFVYAMNYPKFLFFQNENLYSKYTESQRITLNIIQNVYNKIKRQQLAHPYSIYYFQKTCIENNSGTFFFDDKNEFLSIYEFIQKIHSSKSHIESIKRYLFHFNEKFPYEMIDSFLNYLVKYNLLSFDKIENNLLFNKNYFQYAINNKLKIKYFSFNSNFMQNSYLPLDTAKHIISLLDNSPDNINNIKSILRDISIYTIRNFIKNEKNYENYKNVLIYFFVIHKEYFNQLFMEMHNLVEKTAVTQIFNDLYRDEQFRFIFNRNKDNMNIENNTILDFIHTYDNIANF